MIFGFFKRKPKRTYQFDNIPDGKYIVQYVDETYSYDEFILVTLEVTRGAHAGSKIPAMFNSKKAKKVSREYSGQFLSRLGFEGDNKALCLDSAIEYAQHDSKKGEFIINLKDSYVSSVPEYDDEAVAKLIKKLNR